MLRTVRNGSESLKRRECWNHTLKREAFIMKYNLVNLFCYSIPF